MKCHISRRSRRLGQCTLLLGLCASLFTTHAFADDVGDEFPSGYKKIFPRVHGRIYVDGQSYTHSTTPLGTTVDVKAARLSLSGKVRPDWRYLIQYDFAGKSLKDAWMRYEGWQGGRIRIGQYQEPFSIEELTSSRFITFIQRGLPNALVPGYNVGLEVQRRTKLWTATVGLFGERVGSKTSTNGGNSGVGVTGRVTVSPVNRDREVLHLGLAATYRLTNNQHTMRIRTTPETPFTSVRYLNTGTLSNVHRYISGDVEAAAVAGSWSLQGEYIQTDVTRSGGLGRLKLYGAYGYISWFPTGESRNYQEGRFRRVKPIHSLGALELAARYSFLDLNSGSVTGGKEEDATLGVNWYLNSHMRVMLNFVKVRAHVAGRTETPNVYLARFQSDF